MKTPGTFLMDDEKYIFYTCLLQYFCFFVVVVFLTKSEFDMDFFSREMAQISVSHSDQSNTVGA